MSVAPRSVRVLALPKATNRKVSKAFLAEIAPYADAARPRFVLDCSSCGSLTLGMIELMVCVLEEAMKSNGDVRLACLSIEGQALLVSAGASRLFESFATVEAAVISYRRAASLAPIDGVSMTGLYSNESAA